MKSRTSKLLLTERKYCQNELGKLRFSIDCLVICREAKVSVSFSDDACGFEKWLLYINYRAVGTGAGAGRAIALCPQISAGVEVKPFSSKDHGLLKYFVITQLFDRHIPQPNLVHFLCRKNKNSWIVLILKKIEFIKSSGFFSFFYFKWTKFG